MTYVSPNYKTKKALKLAIENNVNIHVWEPGILAVVPSNGTVYLEGPHFPEPHRWYAQGTMRDGKLIAIK